MNVNECRAGGMQTELVNRWQRLRIEDWEKSRSFKDTVMPLTPVEP